MTTGRVRNRHGFTLAELIMAIALLAFFSTMIVQVFFQAQTVTLRTETLDRAVNCASDLADQWKQSQDRPHQSESPITIYLDQAFEVCQKDVALYQADLTVQPGVAANLWLLDIAVFHYPDKGDEPIYALQAGHYFGAERGVP
ncbi:MAG: prepilin-type N-terminal cleavage/methylation domain-containing protein [Bacillota bacterium]|nr:prepilin-type N-terminal cleavage/methylation domain-containing protein [Bacillota bacterium]